MNQLNNKRTRAQEARAAIERLYIAMKHLFIRGSYKPLGISGEGLIESLMTLRPEIYGSIADPERVELDGLMYIFERLPKGIEECRFIKLISREGYETSSFTPLEAGKRRRDCYRVDDEQMFIEVTRGRSDIYDILTHLTFMYVEAEKIRKNSIDRKGRIKREWEMLCDIIDLQRKGESFNQEVAYTYLSSILGRTFQETLEASQKFETNKHINSLFHIVYHLGKISFSEALEGKDREVSFSSALREKIGHHVYSEQWAQKIKMVLHQHDLLNRPIHIISANMHSVMNSIYAQNALPKEAKKHKDFQLFEVLSNVNSSTLQSAVKNYASENGLIYIKDTSGTNINVQIIDTEKIDFDLHTVVSGCIAGYRQVYSEFTFLLDTSHLNKKTTNLTLHGSPEHIVQLLDKVIHNAVEFSEDKVITLELNHHQYSHAELLIHNNGVLLPKLLSENLFDSMVSLRDAHSIQNTKQPHLGLGLYIARLICQFHQGSISAHNHHSPEGVTVKITLPTKV